MLHVKNENGAKRLYEKLGFRVRCEMHLTVLLPGNAQLNPSRLPAVGPMVVVCQLWPCPSRRRRAISLHRRAPPLLPARNCSSCSPSRLC